MPFKSEQQRKFLWAAHPDIAKRWAHEYPTPKNLPKRVSDTPERDKQAHSAPIITPEYVNTLLTSVIFQASSEKQGNSGIKLNIPHSEKPVAAGDEHVTTGNKRRDKQRQGSSASIERLFGLGEGKKAASSGAPEYCVNPLLLKLAVVLSQPIQQALADEQAQQQGQQAQQVPANGGLQPLTTPLSANPLPLGAQQQAQPPQPGQPPAPPAQQVPMQPPQQVPVQSAPKTAALAAGLKPLMPPAAAKPAVAVKPVQTKPAQKPIQPLKPLGDKSNPSANPINAFGPISMSGVVNGNAALGAPGAGKMAAADGQKPPAQNFLATGATNLANTAIQHPIGQKVLGGVSSAYNSFMPQAGKNMAKKLVPNYASPEHIQDFGMQGKWQPDPFVDKSFEQGVHVNSTDSLRNTSTSTNGVGNNNEQLSSSIQTYRPVQVTGTPMQQIAHGVAGGAMPGQTFRAGQPAFLHQNMSEQSNSGTGASNRNFTEHLTSSVPDFQKQNAAANKSANQLYKQAGLFYRDLDVPNAVMMHDNRGAGLGAMRTQEPRLLTSLFSNKQKDVQRALNQLDPAAGNTTDPSQHISALLGQQLIANHPSRYAAPSAEDHTNMFLNDMGSHSEPTTEKALNALKKQYAPMTAAPYLNKKQKEDFNLIFHALLGSHNLPQRNKSAGQLHKQAGAHMHWLHANSLTPAQRKHLLHTANKVRDFRQRVYQGIIAADPQTAVRAGGSSNFRDDVLEQFSTKYPKADAWAGGSMELGNLRGPRRMLGIMPGKLQSPGEGYTLLMGHHADNVPSTVDAVSDMYGEPHPKFHEFLNEITEGSYKVPQLNQAVPASAARKTARYLGLDNYSSLEEFATKAAELAIDTQRKATTRL